MKNLKIIYIRLVMDKKETGSKYGKQELQRYFRVPNNNVQSVSEQEVLKLLQQDGVMRNVFAR